MWPGPSSPLQADRSRLSLLLPTSFGLSFAWTGADKWRNNPFKRCALTLQSTKGSCIVSKTNALFVAYFSLIPYVLFFQNFVGWFSVKIKKNEIVCGIRKIQTFPDKEKPKKKQSQQHRKNKGAGSMVLSNWIIITKTVCCKSIEKVINKLTHQL